jgi:hypothetical protein
MAAFSLIAASSHGRPNLAAKINDPWAKLPFTAREWARQCLLPYRKIPLKNGGTMAVQSAYDLYLKVGQPEYPDMDTPGLVTESELNEQIKLSKTYNKR